MEEILKNLTASPVLRIVAFTGAGISAESGVPTFRGNDGLWRNYRAEDLATPEAFFRDPEVVWEWYEWRRNLISQSRPNEGHLALVELEKTPGIDLTVVTQNVDGLHALAGSESLIELHGNIFVVRCTEEGTEKIDRGSQVPLPPSCDDCGALLRPGVVWFGEQLDPASLDRAAEIITRADLLLVIGTSAVVYPAAGLASLCNGLTIEVNSAATAFSSSADLVIRDSASTALPSLARTVISHLEASC